MRRSDRGFECNGLIATSILGPLAGRKMAWDVGTRNHKGLPPKWGWLPSGRRILPETPLTGT
jgi:hypothetical protein